ncbi:MAG: NTP transferase domain-containing protein [Bacteroidota bacterium]
MRKKHQKHANLSKPNYGNFARNEWAIIGAPCGNIQRLAYGLINILKDTYKVGYVDADHKNADDPDDLGNENPALINGASLEYTDKIFHHRFDTKSKLDVYQYRTYCNEQDLVLVNGNHFKAKNQIVVIDPKKEKSLEKKLDRLTNVELLLLLEERQEVYPFLKDYLPENVTVLNFSATQSIADIILKKMKAAIPPLYGLVLAGGKSTRMGTDKGALNYHGKPQREYLADLLDQFCEKTLMSVRPDQGIESAYEQLEDTFFGLGPFGAILSGFRQYPNVAWLVVACDLPLLNEATLRFLIENRNVSQHATAIYNPDTNFPEPLITIWEPRSYPVLFQFLAQGYSCPRKILINTAIELLYLEDYKVLMNVNDREGYERVKRNGIT